MHHKPSQRKRFNADRFYASRVPRLSQQALVGNALTISALTALR